MRLTPPDTKHTHREREREAPDRRLLFCFADLTLSSRFFFFFFRVGVLAFLIAPALGWVLFNSTAGLLGQYDRTKKEADRIEKKTNKFF